MKVIGSLSSACLPVVVYTSGRANNTEPEAYALSDGDLFEGSVDKGWQDAPPEISASPEAACKRVVSVVIESVCVRIKCENMLRTRSKATASTNAVILIKPVLLDLTDIFFIVLELNTSMGKSPVRVRP